MHEEQSSFFIRRTVENNIAFMVPSLWYALIGLWNFTSSRTLLLSSRKRTNRKEKDVENEFVMQQGSRYQCCYRSNDVRCIMQQF